uniref:Uncharacterized protein n=1 Tax=Salix viminalis TaxID=40686 RepID=A0A6N2LD95_SALVM
MPNVLYGMLKMGSEYVNELFVVSLTIFMCAGLGCVDITRKVFDHCLETKTDIWDTILVDICGNRTDGEVTFLLSLTAVSQFQCLDLAHAFAIKNLAVLNAVIVMYSRCDSIHTSFKVSEKWWKEMLHIEIS